jgi:heme-degrading monooxygenase HmoA
VPDPIAVIIRFNGDPDELLERFERARRSWVEAQDADYERPAFYAACRTDDGIAIVSGWRSAAAHRAFGQRLHAHTKAAGLSTPDQIERLRVARLGWD